MQNAPMLCDGQTNNNKDTVSTGPKQNHTGRAGNQGLLNESSLSLIFLFFSFDVCMNPVLFLDIIGPGCAGVNGDLNTTNAPTHTQKKNLKGGILLVKMFLSSQSLGHVEHNFRVIRLGVASPSPETGGAVWLLSSCQIPKCPIFHPGTGLFSDFVPLALLSACDYFTQKLRN